MAETIWKFTLQADTTLQLPENAEVLTVAAQRAEINLWARVDPAAPTEERRFVTVGTGQDIPAFPCDNYIGTSFIDGGRFVFHTFEVFHE